MGTSDLMHRLLDAMRTMVVFDDEGIARLNPEIDALQTELDAALRGPGHEPELKRLADQIGMIRKAASDPRVAASMAESMAAAQDPQPEIFTAIDRNDPQAIHAVLDTVDVNARYGKFDKTALYHAMSSIEDVSLEMVTVLLDAGADPRLGLAEINVLHGLGFANLRGISVEDLARVIRRCVDMGADLEQRSDWLCWTPLITAASEWNEIATEALLLAGADIQARAGDVDGVCLAGENSLAFADGHEPTMAVLKRYMSPN